MTIRFPAAPRLLLLLAATLVLGGSFARVYELDRMLVWHDEVFTMVRVFGFPGAALDAFVFSGRDLSPADLLTYQSPSVEQGWKDTLASLMEHPEHSPLYYLVARFVAPTFDSSVLAMRGTSALLAILLMPAVFWLSRELFDDAKTAWIAAALSAWSPIHMLYAQEARQYALWTVLCAAGSAALLRALRTGRRRDWALYCALIALGLYAHLLFALVLAAHAAYLISNPRGDAKRIWGELGNWGVSVGLALLLFSPWIWVVVTRSQRMEQVTAWMERPVAVERVLTAWGDNLVRIFADIPSADAFLLIALLPLAWALWRFCSDAPRAARLFVCFLFGALAVAVFLPDLIQGGRRSLHPRYLLPAFLAVELAVAYVIAARWDASSRAERAAARSGFLLIMAAGIWSTLLFLQAETWWHKNFSSRNGEVAALVNGAERPLVLISRSSVGLGEIISLAYELDARAIIRGESGGAGTAATSGFTDIFLLTPSAEVRAALGTTHMLEPVLGTWQWFRALPKVPSRSEPRDPAAPGQGAGLGAFDRGSGEQEPLGITSA